MNILLLGNGFDLYHKLPTRYDNFLHTVDFLINNYTPEMTTVAHVLGNEKLQAKDKFIAECYVHHKEAYEHISLDEAKILEIITLAKDNIWFSYLLQSFNREVGWIDLEREIAFVIDSFKEFLKDTGKLIYARKLSNEQQYILKKFDFFSQPYKSTSINGPTEQITEAYTIEYPLGSRVYIRNKDKIIQHLVDELNIFTKVLRLYLQCFIESSLFDIREKSLSKCAAITYIDKVITFNYTGTYEFFYSHYDIHHLHGNINKKIILGINPDESDKLETIDTSFVKFKKYFQRTQYNTDCDYISWINNLKETNEFKTLLVMGHSLDITDKDIIIELFRKMDVITVLYHSEEAKAIYISNLIKMFGKEEFDNLRKQKKLTFLSLDMDFSAFIKARERTSLNYIQNRVF